MQPWFLWYIKWPFYPLPRFNYGYEMGCLHYMACFSLAIDTYNLGQLNPSHMSITKIRTSGSKCILSVLTHQERERESELSVLTCQERERARKNYHFIKINYNNVKTLVVFGYTWKSLVYICALGRRF